MAYSKQGIFYFSSLHSVQINDKRTSFEVDSDDILDMI